MLKTRAVKVKTVKITEEIQVKAVPETKAVEPLETITIVELIRKFGTTKLENVCVRVVNKTVPALLNRWKEVRVPAGTIASSDILITSATVYDTDQNYIRYMSEDGFTFGNYVPDNFQVILLKDVDKSKFMKRWEEQQIADLHVNLQHSWMIDTTPEIFVEDESGNCIPSFLYLSGKDNPAKTMGSTADWNNDPNGNHFGAKGGCNMYWNGFQTEFNTQSQSCLGWQMDSIAAGIAGVYKAARTKFPSSRLSVKSVMDIPHDMLMAAEDQHVDLMRTAVHNAYGIKVNAPTARDIAFRSAGGPICFNMGKLNEEQATPIVKMLDAILGVACVSLFAQLDDPRRRTIHGLPGEYTLLPRGLEYRTLSNAWLCHPMITNLVIDLSRKVAIFGQKGFSKYWHASEEDVISCIIECDVEKAHALMDKNKVLMMKIFRAAYPWASETNTQETLYNIFYAGAQTAVKDPTDFVSNWTLDGVWHTHSDGKNKNVARSYAELMASKEFRVS